VTKRKPRTPVKILQNEETLSVDLSISAIVVMDMPGASDLFLSWIGERIASDEKYGGVMGIRKVGEKEIGHPFDPSYFDVWIVGAWIVATLKGDRQVPGANQHDNLWVYAGPGFPMQTLDTGLAAFANTLRGRIQGRKRIRVRPKNVEYLLSVAKQIKAIAQPPIPPASWMSGPDEAELQKRRDLEQAEPGKGGAVRVQDEDGNLPG
jgi:hypothetical protein